MSIIRLAFELFIIYLLYKLVVDFIVPLYRTTKQVKKKMTDMHRSMQEREEAASAPKPRQAEPLQKKFSDDYIDYEEVK